MISWVLIWFSPLSQCSQSQASLLNWWLNGCINEIDWLGRITITTWTNLCQTRSECRSWWFETNVRCASWSSREFPFWLSSLSLFTSISVALTSSSSLPLQSNIAREVGATIPRSFTEHLSIVYFPQLGYLNVIPRVSDERLFENVPDGWNFQVSLVYCGSRPGGRGWYIYRLIVGSSSRRILRTLRVIDVEI